MLVVRRALAIGPIGARHLLVNLVIAFAEAHKIATPHHTFSALPVRPGRQHSRTRCPWQHNHVTRIATRRAWEPEEMIAARGDTLPFLVRLACLW